MVRDGVLLAALPLVRSEVDEIVTLKVTRSTMDELYH